IVEPFPILQERQARTLDSFREKIEWCDSLQPFVGVHFSNELLDAMPVRLIGHGRERFVGLDGDKFVFVDRPGHGDANFNQAALDWIDTVAVNLQRGYVITIDYWRSGAQFHGKIQGRAFQVLALSKNVDFAAPKLAGFKFAG